MKLYASLFAAGLAFATSAVQAEAQRTGEMMANTCAACHGTQGRLEALALMPLAGMEQEEFIRAMTDFRSGARPSTLMGSLATGFSEAEIKAMAEFFAAQPLK